jgi:hypothetical protein
MKNYFILLFIPLALVLLFSCNNANPSKTKDAKDSTTVSTNAEVIIYYFHGDRRCPSCIAIEDETNKTLELGFKTEHESGKISFQDINIDKEENSAIAEKYQVAGSALFIIKKENGKDADISDLTGDGFKFALNKPEMFNEKLTAVINKYLKK